MSDGDISMGEQAAFSAAHELIKNLKFDNHFTSREIGKGVLIAALSCLRKEMTNEEVAGLFYEVADDYACREKGY